MKTISLKHSIQIALLTAACAVPMAFAQADTTPTPTPMQEGSTQPAEAAPPMAADGNTTSAKPMSWKDLDVNKDGKLSKAEVAGDAQWTADFDTSDTNKDGYLSKAEFKAHKAEMKKMAHR